MNKRKKIIFFSDLEGTLIGENGKIDCENFYNFGVQLKSLADAFQADIDIIVLSPMGPNFMTPILRDMDNSLSLVEKRTKDNKNSVKIVAAAADFNDIDSTSIKRIDRRIDYLNIGTRQRGFSLNPDMKLHYINNYLNENNNNAIFYIYAGNGDNDYTAMKKINTLKNGITVCPTNSTEKVKSIAKKTSTLIGVVGVKDCIQQVIREHFPTQELEDKSRSK